MRWVFWVTLAVLSAVAVLASLNRGSRVEQHIRQIMGASVTPEEHIVSPRRWGIGLKPRFSCLVVHPPERSGNSFCESLGLKEADRTDKDLHASELALVFKLDPEFIESNYRVYAGILERAPSYYVKAASSGTNTLLLMVRF